MKIIYIAFSLPLLFGCANTGHVVSGQLNINDVSQSMAGKSIILNDDCSPQKIELPIPYCGSANISKNEICTTTPDEQQYGYKIFQVINKNDALICTINRFGGCYGNVEYVKNLGAQYEELIDDAKLEDNILLKKNSYSYSTAFGTKTVKGYELVTKAKFSKIKYIPNRKEKCTKKEYSYSKEYSMQKDKNSSGWIKEED